MSERKIFINKSELGAGTTGAGLAFTSLNYFAKQYPNSNFNQLEKIVIPDFNNSLEFDTDFKSAKRIDYIAEVCEKTVDIISPFHKNTDNFSLIISGDHSSALSSIASLKAAQPNAKLGVIWVDAHYDLHTPYTTPSGNVHGMPLSASMSLDNLDCKKNEIDDNTKKYWEKLKKIGVDIPKLLPENLVYIGVRDFEVEEEFIVNKFNIKNFTVSNVRSLGTNNVAEYILNYLSECDYLYISLDVDSMDPDEVSYGTGTPVKNGLHISEVKEILDVILKSEKVISTEVVEINPLLDDDNFTMVKTAFDLINHILSKKCLLWKNNFFYTSFIF